MTTITKRQGERWTATKKLGVIEMIDAGLMTPADVLWRYLISPEELAEWRRFYAAAGIEGLRAKRMDTRKRLWR
jgi:hypothetical protein